MKPFLVSLVIAGLLATPTPANASCAPPLPIGTAIEETDIVFVGTVTATTNGRRWATVTVEEIWKGEGIDRVVEIKAGPADPPGPTSAVSTVDRSFDDGVRYLFFPFRAKNGLADSACSNTTRFRPELERFRPGSARILGEDTPDTDGRGDATSLPLAIGAAILVAGLLFARRRVAN